MLAQEVLTEVLSDLQIRIEESDATVEFGEVPAIECDAMQMRQLLQNLIGNALKFRKPDVAPVITVVGGSRDQQTRPPGSGHVVLTIEDNGIGFENQFKEQIFTIFQRLHSRNEYEGTGIGLATVPQDRRAPRRQIDADGQPGVGAKFYVTLPQKQAEGEGGMSRSNHPIRIVVADDDADDRMMIKDAFEESKLGNPVDFVEDGVQLMEYLRREGEYASSPTSPIPASSCSTSTCRARMAARP